MPHTRRPRVSIHRPHHVTVRVARGTWNLRSQRCFVPIREALRKIKDRRGFRVVHYSVQHDHLHLVTEASSRRALSSGMKALLIRIARGLNGVMGARGRRFDDRYHEHILKTPREASNALKYVLGNRDVHLERWGKAPPGGGTDAFSSQTPAATELVHPASVWLLTEGWQRAGP
jgi:putative transposase